MKNLVHILMGVLGQLLITSTTLAQVHAGAIFGTVVSESKEAIPLCTILLMKNSQISAGIITDAEGNFILGNVESGLYDLKISSVGFSSKYIRDIRIDGNEVSIPPIEMRWGVQLSSVICSAYRPYCIKPCGFGCICECCVPPSEFHGKEPANHSGAIVSVDTTSFLALTSWRSKK
ncbi:MAG: carboxypeptidase-like regulatory domain-containing protein [Flavobacteriales bacterium]|nr:carboxypeptidase-like regulatory domain-containing protein [Flavobacteriales bacterium]